MLFIYGVYSVISDNIISNMFSCIAPFFIAETSFWNLTGLFIAVSRRYAYGHGASSRTKLHMHMGSLPSIRVACTMDIVQ